MRNFLAQIWATLTTLCSAAERGATAFDHLARVAEEEAASFADEATVKRQARLKELTST